MSNTALYVKDGDTLRLRDSQDTWKVIREAGGAAIPSPLGGASVYLPSVMAIGPGYQRRVFQQVSPKFWLLVSNE